MSQTKITNSLSLRGDRSNLLRHKGGFAALEIASPKESFGHFVRNDRFVCFLNYLRYG